MVKLKGTNKTKYGINSLNFRGAILWNRIPKNMKFRRRYQNLREGWKST